MYISTARFVGAPMSKTDDDNFVADIFYSLTPSQ